MTVALSTSSSSSSPVTTSKRADWHIIGDVLLTTANAQGHFRPMMALGELLSRYSKGALRCHLLATIPDDIKLPTSEYPNVNVLRLRLPNDVAAPSQLIEQFHWLMDNRDEIISQGCTLTDSLNVVAVLYDMFFVWGRELADAMGVKHFGVATSPLHCYYLWVNRACFVPLSGDVSEEQRTLPELGVLSAKSMPYVPQLAEHFGKVVDVIESSRSLIVNDSPCQPGFAALCDAVEKRMLVPTPKFGKGGVHALGYLTDYVTAHTEAAATATAGRPNNDTVDDDMVLQWLDLHDPNTVIFIALGSWVELSIPDLIELAETLATLEAPFLWALRDRSNPPSEEELKNLACEVDSRGLPVDFLDRVISHSYLAPWVNQRQVLAHPSIKLFVTHCGWNSLTEALSLTPAPKALLPVATDQFLNAEIAERFWKVGLQLWSTAEDDPNRKYLNREDLKERILKLCSDPEILSSSREFWEQHRTHIDNDAEVCVRRLIAEIDS